MTDRTRTQIFGVEHPDDALAVAAAGASHLGFCPAEDPALLGFQPSIPAAEARALFDQAVEIHPRHPLVLDGLSRQGPR